MVILGALVNGIATVIGGVLGLVFKRRVSQKLGDFLMQGLGLCVMLASSAKAFKSVDPIN